MKKSVLLAFALLLSIASYSSSKVCISNIYIKGNKITDSTVIFNEIPFNKGDSVDVASLSQIFNECKNNLLNLSLFNYVDVAYITDTYEKGSINVFISVEERWYYWPMISVVFEDRNLSTWLKSADWNKITLEAGVKAYNLQGLNHTLTVSYKMGFQKGFRLEYEKINLDKKGKHLLDFGIGSQLSKTIPYKSLFNAPAFVSVKDDFIEEKYSFGLGYTYRSKIKVKHSFKFMFEFSKIKDTIFLLNPTYWGNSDTKHRSFALSYIYNYDGRDNYQYPTQGFSFRAETGMYITDDLSVRYGHFKTDIQLYNMHTPRIYSSFKIMTGNSLKNVDAYILDKAIGYNNVNLRGYEYYVADGQHYFVAASTLKYKILKKRVFTIGFLSFLPKFNKIHFTIYGKGFFDIGYASNSHKSFNNYLSNRLLYSGGAGLDIVSYYDTVFSVEYSANQFRDRGFFFSVKTPIF